MTELEKFEEKVEAARAAYTERLTTATERKVTTLGVALEARRQAVAVALRDLRRAKSKGAAVDTFDLTETTAWSEEGKARGTAEREFAKEKEVAGKKLSSDTISAAEELGGKR